MADHWLQAQAAGLQISEMLLVCGMTAVGLNVAIRELRGVGMRAVAAALLVALIVGACSLGLTLAMQGLSTPA